MAYKVKTDAFEGPFDLLLYLVSKKRVDIGAISVAEIADQYLAEVARMSNLDLDVASDFLLVASTLLEMKARALVPKPAIDIDEDVEGLPPDEAREVLTQKLIAYKQFKNASEELYARFLAEGRMHARTAGPGSDFADLLPDFLAGVAWEDVAHLAAQALARREVFLLESEHIASKPIPVETFVRTIHERIIGEKRLSFNELVREARTPEVVVVTFLAVLELYKRQMVYLAQPEAFGDIDIEYIEGSGALFIDQEEQA